MTPMLASCPGSDGRPTNPFEPFPRADLEGSLTARFMRQVARDPHRLAVKMGAAVLSYRALDRAANRVADAICDRIGGGNEPVALLLPQSVDQVVAVLGALKAGKIYVPLDPAHPPARLGEAVADAGARLVVTSTRFAGLAGAVGPSTPAVEVDALRDDADGLATEAPAVAIRPDAGAYIFYTSGSTGRPKGVLDTHRNVLHNVMRYTNTLHLTSDDRLTLLQGPSFSGAVSSLFGALLNGATSLLFDVSREGAERLAGWLAEEAVTVYHSVPALFRAIAPYGRSLPALRLIRLEGDRATPRDLALFREHFAPDCVLVNGLGATECGLVRQFFFTTACTVPDGVVPIGEAVEDMDVVVLDAAGRAAESGEPGEIAVRSAYLAAGYWNQPELTAARFVVEPDRPGTRLYRTGDLGRLRSGGMLELLGRRDGMAKVRGHHVEAAEVEAALLALPGVAEAAALVREDTPGETRLVAYLVAAGHDGLTPSALRQALAERLPDFMLPSAFVFLDRLPLDGNRKVDRHALPAPGASPSTRTMAAPRTPRERELARIWATVLDVETVGIDDDFFDLGGNSVLAALVLARAHATWGVEIDLATFAASPTIKALARALEGASGDAPAAPLAPARRGQAVPLLPTSFAQERLWFVDQLDPGRSAYNLGRAWRVAGPLDAGALERALRYLGRRHEALRTEVVGMDGRPWQRVLPDTDIALVVTDLARVEAAMRDAEAERFLAEESLRPFDLARGPLWRARLLRLDDSHHVLVVTMHHIVCDGWSMDVLSRELSAAYRAGLANQDPALPPLPIQYADFAAWQRERLSSGALEPLLAHWRARLAGAPTALTIATDRPRPARPRGRSARLPFTVPAGITAALRALGRREGATLFMTLLAGYALLLHRRSGQTDVLIGAPMANRPRREVEGLIGLFLDTLVLRVDCGERPTFRELLGRTRATAFDAYAHQDLPFERLVEAVRPGRGPAGTPLLSALLNLLNQPASPLRLDRLTVTRLEVPSSGSKFDLSLALHETPAGLEGALTYDADLFDPGTAQTLLTQLTRVLEHVAVDPDCRLDEIPLVSEAERGALVARGQGPAAPAPSAPSLAALVEAQAARTPDAVAVVQGERTLTYAALIARARRLARQIRVLGAGQDEPVGVCLGRSPDLVVALLAALEAGAPYIALDPDDPPARIGRTLQAAGARCVLTRIDLESRCGGNGLATICLDREDTAADDGEATPLADGPGPDDLAYIAFTSGSTGAPKGVAIAHRGVVSYLEFLVRTFGLGPSDVVLQLARASFDASVREIFAPLAVGARVVLLADGEAPDAVAILARLRAHQVTALLAVVPSVLRPLTGAAEDRGLSAPALRLVLTTGEPLIYDDVRRVRRHLAPGAEVVNQYGPTECTMTCTFYRVDGDGVDGVDGVVPIGRPIAGMSALVLDPALGPVPAGVPGELYLGGVGVARGYLGDPELTERRFVPDPFAPSPGGRLYKTGDLVRARPDGVLEFLGRIDRQIKVRGIRTEPAEAEHALREHPAVREVAVVPWEPTPGDQRLAAYVVGRGTASLDRHALRQYARDHLPAHLVPAAFVPVAALPLTANRKLDRDALAPPGPADAIGAPAHVAPRTPLESALADIWGEMLGLPRVGVLDDFFDLGGHSLLAARLVARLRDRLGLDVPLRQIFETPTIADLVLALLDAQMETGLVDAPDPVSPEPSGEAGHLDESTLRGLFSARARHTPEAPAILAPDRSPLPYRALRAQVDAAAATLARAGLGRRARVALVAPPGPEMAVALLAVATAAVCVPLNPAYPEPELEAILAEAKLDALIAPADTLPLAVARRLGLVTLELHAALAEGAAIFSLAGPAAGAPARGEPAGPDDVALVLLTSGTTARPKRVPLTHRALIEAARGHRRALALEAADCCLDLMPLFHVNGLMMLLASLEAGAAAVCPSRFESARVFPWIAETRPTWLNGTPTVHQGILGQAALDPAAARAAIARPLRFVRSASAPLPACVAEELERLFAAPVIESYGQTETATLVAVSPLPPRPRKPGAVGLAAGPEIAIMDREGRRVPAGDDGEIVVRGPSVMAGYEDDPEAAAWLADGWFRTGDLGRLDADGFLSITGRIKDVINRGGEKIAPREIDEILLAHPAVRDAVTFGVPHRTLGEDVAAAVVLAEGATLSPAALRQFAAERVAAFKVPRRIVLLAAIPRGLTGKPDRAALLRTVSFEIGG